MKGTRLDSIRQPPINPWVVGGKIAISCHKDRDFLIRAWAPRFTSHNEVVNWILYYVGRMNQSDLEWFGYTYSGQPSYMTRGEERYESGLTIQHFVAPKPGSIEESLLDKGRVGPSYGTAIDLEIPVKGHVQRSH